MTGPSPPRILLVEVDQALAASTTSLLGDAGEISWAASAEDALRMLERGSWQLMVVDINLPGISGFDLIREAKQRDPLLETLILTGEASFQNAVEAIRAGADDFMTKPVRGTELIAKVGEMTAITVSRRNEGRQSVLAIGAHPDDIEIGIGGTLFRHVARGDSVTLLTLTGGERGGVPAERAEESRKAAELLSATLYHRDLSDTNVENGGNTINMIKEVIDKAVPSTIYTHTSNDVHQDHRSIHSASLVAGRGVPKIYCYQAPSTTVDFNPIKFIAVDEFIDLKLEAIEAFASQVKHRAYLDPDLLRATARYWSRFTKNTYVEPLEVIRESDSLADDFGSWATWGHD